MMDRISRDTCLPRLVVCCNFAFELYIILMETIVRDAKKSKFLLSVLEQSALEQKDIEFLLELLSLAIMFRLST